MGSVRGGVRTNEFGAFFDSITAGDRAIYAPIMDAVLSLLGNGSPGVVSGLLDELEISPVAPPASSILIAAGAALLGGSGAHVFALTEELTLPIPAAAPGNSRIDRIGVRLDGRTSPDEREITIARIAGVEAASNPSVPPIPDAQNDLRYFFDLAHVTVSGVDSIVASAISDERTYRGTLALSDDAPEDVSAAAATAGTGADASRDTHGHQAETGDAVDVGTANDPGSGSALALANHEHNVPTGLRGISADSPAFTGTPTTPDPPAAANTQQLANARWVRARIADLIASAPGALDTLNELAAALGDDPNFATTIAASIALKASLDSPTFTGTPTAPTASSNANTQQLANARWVRSRITDLIGGAPGALNTLNELAAAIDDDPNFASTIAASIAAIPQPVLSGSRAPTVSDGVDGNLWVRSDAPAAWVRAAGAWQRLFIALAGTLLGSWPLDSANVSPIGLAYDGTDLYVGDNNTDRVYRYSLAGTLLGSWPLDSANDNPIGLASDGTDLYVGDNNTDRVYRYSLAGTLLGSWPLDSANDRSRGLASDGTDLYVGDTTTDRVYRYSLVGTLLGSWPLDSANGNPSGLAYDGTDLYVGDASDRVYRYSLAGTLLGLWPLDSANGNPSGLAYDGTDLYVGDLNKRVFRYAI